MLLSVGGAPSPPRHPHPALCKALSLLLSSLICGVWVWVPLVDRWGARNFFHL